MFRLHVRVQRRVNRNEARMRWKLLDEGGMHLCTAAQLHARVTPEPIPERQQKGPKTEGEREREGGRNVLLHGRICSFAKKGQRRRQLRMFVVTKERFCPPSNFTMGDWQQMTEGRPFRKILTTLPELAPSCTSLALFVRRIVDKVLVIQHIEWINF